MKRPRAFTVIELIAVMGIISVLIALLIPSLFLARERARRIQCLNNLKQIGMAFHSYLVTYEMFPPGSIRPLSVSDDAKSHFEDLSWTVQILPYLEQGQLSSSLDDTQGGFAPANTTTALAHLSVLTCPTGKGPFQTRGGPDLPISSYAGCHHDVEAPIATTNHGILYLNSMTRQDDISDGLSQTFLAGELSYPDSQSWISGSRATLRNTGHPINGVDVSSAGLTVKAGEPPLPENLSAFNLERRIQGGAILAPPSFVGGFGSNHPGDGAHFLLGDGAARFVKSSIHRDIYRRLGNRSDGEIIDDESY